MKTKELIDNASNISGMSYKDCKNAIDALVNVIKNNLKNGEQIQIIGFGTFYTSERSERIGINLQTRNTMVIPAKKVAKWKPSKNILD